MPQDLIYFDEVTEDVYVKMQETKTLSPQKIEKINDHIRNNRLYIQGPEGNVD